MEGLDMDNHSDLCCEALEGEMFKKRLQWRVFIPDLKGMK